MGQEEFMSTGYRTALTASRLLRALMAGLLTITITFVAMWNIMRLKHANLTIPLQYSSDALCVETLVKGLIEHGWYIENPSIGAPGKFQMYDYPMADSLHFLIMKALSLVSNSFAVVCNLYYLLTYPLVAISALIVFRHFGVSLCPSLVGSILYAFLPYHFQRGMPHLFLSAYYLVPPVVMVALWVFRSLEPEKPANDLQAIKRMLCNPRFLVSILICLAGSSAGVYYAFFGCYLLCVAGASACMLRRSLKPAVPTVCLALVVCLGCFANGYPSIRFWKAHGPNHEVGARKPAEAEFWALKISQLFVPIVGHRLKSFATMETRYGAETSLFNTNDYLGMVGCTGFFYLLSQLVRPRFERRRDEMGHELAVLTIASLLLASVGGFGSLLSVFFVPSIRCYYRMAVYIGFFCLFGAVLMLDRLLRRYPRGFPSMIAAQGALIILLVLGLMDQTAKCFAFNYEYARVEYGQDQVFVKRIEEALPRSAMVFQLPYKPFPESGVCPHNLQDYELFRPYLNSSRLRWSYGAMRGREEDRWQAAVSAKPIRDLVRAVYDMGFRGIYIDRIGYADRAAGLERELSILLGPEPMVGPNGRMAFSVSCGMERRAKIGTLNHRAGFNQRLMSRISDSAWEILWSRVLVPWSLSPPAAAPKKA
jgi:phosphoglycerol transferase